MDLGYRLVNPKRVDLTGPTEEIEEPEDQGDKETWGKKWQLGSLGKRSRGMAPEEILK